MNTFTTAAVLAVVSAAFATACGTDEASEQTTARPAAPQRPPAADAYAIIEASKARAFEEAVRAAKRARVSDAADRRQPAGPDRTDRVGRTPSPASPRPVRPGSRKYPDLAP